MIREDNKSRGETTVYEYDTNGNILTKTVYAFALGEIVDRAPIAQIPYAYKADGWRDRMAEYNGEKCEYDAIAILPSTEA